MFQKARRGLALRYAVLFVVVLVAFSVVFVLILSTALQPAFDIGPEVSNEEAARIAYTRTIGRILVAVVVADGVAIAVVAAAAYYLAGRTLRPISEAHDRQRRFVADASHEMRNPLAAIRATAGSAIAGTTSSDEAVVTIAEAADQLTLLTNDLLLLARSEAGRIDGARGVVDLSVLTAEAISTVLTTTAVGADAIEALLSSDLLVDADERELTRVVANLVDNAVRYGQAASPIRVRTYPRDAYAMVEVADNGPGIAAADSARIFEPFFRARSDAEMPPGSGLGLAIAAELARQNGGAIEVISTPGSGSTFILRLPRFR
ncbi:MAG: HAMP domain-containing sensor histidine kinase [Candidatus Limnocylindrales bacterium]